MKPCAATRLSNTVWIELDNCSEATTRNRGEVYRGEILSHSLNDRGLEGIRIVWLQKSACQAGSKLLD
jgi:hypothetical protein